MPASTDWRDLDQVTQAAGARGHRRDRDELTLFLILRKAPPAPFLPPEVHGQPVVAVVGMYAGPLEEGARAMAPLAGAAGRVPADATAYGERAYQRLVDLKRRYDPENRFRLNQNIPPEM